MSTALNNSVTSYVPSKFVGGAEGLTKREFFAAMALQGILANPSVVTPRLGDIKEAVKTADLLIARLKETN